MTCWLGLEEVGMQHESLKGQQVGQWSEGGEQHPWVLAWVLALVARREQMLPEHPLQLRWGRGPPCFAGFRSQKGQSPLLLRLNGTERKGGKEYEEDPCTASKLCVCFALSPDAAFV